MDGEPKTFDHDSPIRVSVPEVLIVGSGPSGLILALSLLKNGIPVRVIEKGTTWRIGQRGAGISPRSLELLESLGVVDEALRRGMDVPMIRFYKMPQGTETLKEILPTPYLDPTPSCPYRKFLVLGQDNLESILRTEMAKFGCKVELGAELQSIHEQSDDNEHDRVQATIHHHSNPDDNATTPPPPSPMKEKGIEIASYKWIIGADGARGTVRKQLDLPFIGETTGESFVIGDVMIEPGVLDPNRWHMWGEIADVLAALRPTETPNLFSFILGGANLSPQNDICASDESLKAYIKSMTGNRDDIKISEIIWMSPYRINIRMVENFRKGRVFVTGDAAHVHSLMGGQGMNTGIQDSYNLGWKLALVAKGLAPPSLLNTYTAERLPVVAEMLNITTGLLKKTVADNNGKGWDRSGSVHQLGVNYRGSAIVVDGEKGEGVGTETEQGVRVGDEDAERTRSFYEVEAGSGVKGGDRAPDASGLVRISGQLGEAADTAKTMRLFQLFSPARHTIILFAAHVDCRPVLESLQKNPLLKDLVRLIVIKKAGVIDDDEVLDTFEDRDGYAHDAYRDEAGVSNIFVIRPDGIVGARVGSVDGLKRYFDGIFGGVYVV